MTNEEKNIELKSEGVITTRVLPGFMELLPAEQIVFDQMKATIEDVYRTYGFVALDTPAIERAEVLLAKAGGETEKQIYHFTKGDNELALRFDLTVPLARYVSEHANDLVFPFRRSHIAKVYRGERPQKGRYREFYQADIDIIGDGTLSLMNDAEIPSVIYAVFKKLDFGPFTIKISNRKLITGLLASLGIAHLSAGVMQTIDKIEKIGEDAVRDLLVELGVTSSAIETIFRFIKITGSPEDVLAGLQNFEQNDEFYEGIKELEEVTRYLKVLGVPRDYYTIDLTIARGLDYYTGTVYETVLRDHPGLGSICSGGRYDNLAEKYTKRKLPGVGISIGLTRLFSQLKEIDLIKTGAATPTKVLVIPLVEDMAISLEIATLLREAGIATEVYFEDVKKMDKKLSYANKKGIPFVVLVGENEIAANAFAVKKMETSEQVALAKDDIVAHIAKEIQP